jgi:hypothetical protein
MRVNKNEPSNLFQIPEGSSIILNINKNIPTIFILLSAYILTYILFYFIPSFLVSDIMMIFDYVPRSYALGIDYQATINMVKDRFSIPYSLFVKLFLVF